MAASAQPLHQSRSGLWLTQPWASRLIATLGVVLVTVGLFVPCAGRDWIVQGNPASRSAETWAIANLVGASLAVMLYVGRMPLAAQLGIGAVSSVLTLGGLGLIPLLWRTLTPKGTLWVRWTYALWLLLLTFLALAGLPAWWQALARPLPGAAPPLLIVGAPYLMPGMAVFPLGVLVSCAALWLLCREPLPTASPAPAPRTDWQWIAALALTVGALTWGTGFYLMPEAVTAACPPVIFSLTQFAHGACAGIDSDQVLQAAYASGRNAGLNPIAFLLYTVGRNFTLLVALGGITTLGGWTRQLAVRTLAWLAVWPLLALGVALVALLGVGAAARQGLQLTVASGAGWHVAAGMVVTFAGIGLVALGQLGLWREWVRRRSVASAQYELTPRRALTL